MMKPHTLQNILVKIIYVNLFYYVLGLVCPISFISYNFIFTFFRVSHFFYTLQFYSGSILCVSVLLHFKTSFWLSSLCIIYLSSYNNFILNSFHVSHSLKVGITFSYLKTETRSSFVTK
jgi:uncharacterized membrane protein